MQRTVGTLFIIVLVVLAGCNGVFAGNNEPTETETITPAPVPTDEPTPTPVPQLVPGLTGAGVENGTALVEAHRSFLRNRSFIALINTTYLAANGSIVGRTNGVAQVEAAGEGYRYAGEQKVNLPRTNASQVPVRTKTWWNGETYFIKSTYQNGTASYRRLSISSQQTGYGFVYRRLGDLSVLQDANNTTNVKVLTRNETTLYRVRRINRSGERGNVTLQLLVNSRGIIREYTKLYQQPYLPNVSESIVEVEILEVGGVDPKRPAWVKKAMNQTTSIQSTETAREQSTTR